MTIDTDIEEDEPLTEEQEAWAQLLEWFDDWGSWYDGCHWEKIANNPTI